MEHVIFEMKCLSGEKKKKDGIELHLFLRENG